MANKNQKGGIPLTYPLSSLLFYHRFLTLSQTASFYSLIVGSSEEKRFHKFTIQFYDRQKFSKKTKPQ